MKTYRNYGRVLDECACINIRRLFYLAIIAIPMRVINILLFAKSYDTVMLKLWSRGIISSHLILLIVMIGFLLITLKLRKKTEPNQTMRALQYIAVAVIMVSGIAIVTFDQLVTTNITPFLLTCVVVGLVFLIRPLISFIVYLASFAAYFYFITLTITSQEVLLSNRANGVTAAAIGFFLSVVLWHYNYTSITQRKRIEAQQKQLEQLAYYDPLTDLPNRRLLEKLISREYASMARYGHEMAIIMLDVDNFKSINDTYGHLAGDNILRQLADLLKKR